MNANPEMSGDSAGIEGLLRDADSVTIYDVAERAGVSIATVSHVLNRPDRVAASTRAKVLETAQKLRFVPRGRGKAARTLRRIAVTGPFSAHPSYLDRLLGLLEASKAGAAVDVIVIDDLPGSGRPVIDAVEARGPLDGVVLMGGAPTARLAAELRELSMAVVVLDYATDEFSTVTVDDELGGRMLADHVLSIGATRVALLSPAPGAPEPITNGERRVTAFADHLHAANPQIEVAWTICDDSFDGAFEATSEFTADRPDIVVALHDRLAAGAVAGLRAQGISVPADIRVVGYDDAEIARMYDLTTMRQPFRSSGFAAFELLREVRRDTEETPRHEVLTPELVTRGSSPSPTTTRTPDASDAPADDSLNDGNPKA